MGNRLHRCALGAAGYFMDAYERNRHEAIGDVIDADMVAVALRTFMVRETEWQGTATELLKELAASVGEAQTKNRAWPETPRALRSALQRVAAPLRKAGIVLEFDRTGRARRIIIRRQHANTRKTPS